jgi:hypothetical protein
MEGCVRPESRPSSSAFKSPPWAASSGFSFRPVRPVVDGIRTKASRANEVGEANPEPERGIGLALAKDGQRLLGRPIR